MHPPVPWYSILPFATLLFCIATFPIFFNHWWEHNRNRLLIALLLGLPVATWMLALGHSHAVLHALLEYGMFITLLLALFRVSGGVFLTGNLPARPSVNTLLLALGAVAASFIGTTGAAMLMIRPILNANQERQYRTHTVVFAIFTIANCGGLLTPLGDPPLFLGMLRGVPFTWTFSLWPQWLLVNGLLLTMYYAYDCYFYARENIRDVQLDELEQEPLGLLGARNLGWLAAVVATVAFVPSIHLAHSTVAAPWHHYVPWRELALIGIIVASNRYVVRQALVRNQFSWAPILEVAALFSGIFLTMVPALLFLEHVAPSLPLTPLTFFLFTGGLSSCLDNAPTYALFFEIAKQLGGTSLVAGVAAANLTAISLGAVFCGAFTYIGNGPNFMVKAIAEDRRVVMPDFFRYMRFAFLVLGPVLTCMVLIFIVSTPLAQLIGWGMAGIIALGSLGTAVLVRRRSATATEETPAVLTTAYDYP